MNIIGAVVKRASFAPAAPASTFADFPQICRTACSEERDATATEGRSLHQGRRRPTH